MSAEQVRRLREDLAAAVAERDRLREDRNDWRNVADDFSAELADTKAERDRLRAVVEHAIETLSESAPSAPGVLATVDLMRLALDPTGEDT